MHEARMHKRNCFVTLTLREYQESLDHSQWQRFAKRVRKKLGPFRFFMAGEYGEERGRPHFHALLFGLDFDDKVYLGKSPGGSKLYRSDMLSELWGLGYCSVGDATFESAAYVARYVMKKMTGAVAEEHYCGRVPEYSKCSTGGRSGRRGIGFSWFARYGKSDVFPDGNVLVHGVRCAAPRYYRKLLREQAPLRHRVLEHERGEVRDARWRADFPDNSRLRAKAAVTDARLGMLKRKI